MYEKSYYFSATPEKSKIQEFITLCIIRIYGFFVILFEVGMDFAN
jgi:hypothetical protein